MSRQNLDFLWLHDSNFHGLVVDNTFNFFTQSAKEFCRCPRLAALYTLVKLRSCWREHLEKWAFDHLMLDLMLFASFGARPDIKVNIPPCWGKKRMFPSSKVANLLMWFIFSLQNSGEVLQFELLRYSSFQLMYFDRMVNEGWLSKLSIHF